MGSLDLDTTGNFAGASTTSIFATCLQAASSVSCSSSTCDKQKRFASKQNLPVFASTRNRIGPVPIRAKNHPLKGSPSESNLTQVRAVVDLKRASGYKNGTFLGGHGSLAQRRGSPR
jgi:hypothetical protein